MESNALFKIGYGVYVIRSKKESSFNGQIANTVFQVTAEPPQIAVCINKQNLTHEFIQESKTFSEAQLPKQPQHILKTKLKKRRKR
ncbi:MAG: flavin reductase [Candidatus Stahlbacteria bacterium]|nr:flavin reductase [Candidatus Stahlbacteria bacterium]